MIIVMPNSFRHLIPKYGILKQVQDNYMVIVVFPIEHNLNIY